MCNQEKPQDKAKEARVTVVYTHEKYTTKRFYMTDLRIVDGATRFYNSNTSEEWIIPFNHVASMDIRSLI